MTIKTIHAGYLCQTLCSKNVFLSWQFLLMEFSWLGCVAQKCVPNFSDAMSDILDLQHAHDFDLCKGKHLGNSNSFIVLSLFV